MQFNGYCLECRGKVPGLFRSLVKRLASMVCASFVNQGEQRVSDKIFAPKLYREY